MLVLTSTNTVGAAKRVRYALRRIAAGKPDRATAFRKGKVATGRPIL